MKLVMNIIETGVATEAFKSGAFDLRAEPVEEVGNRIYFPALKEGKVNTNFTADAGICI